MIFHIIEEKVYVIFKRKNYVTIEFYLNKKNYIFILNKKNIRVKILLAVALPFFAHHWFLAMLW